MSPSSAYFQYIDVWSSRFTWGGLEPPIAGDFVVIPSDMTVLLDIDTPILKLLLIQGINIIVVISINTIIIIFIITINM